MAIPTIRELTAQVIQDLEQSTGLSGIFGKTILRGFAAVQAASIYLSYLSASKVQKNMFPDTADREIDGGTLERDGRIRLGRDPFAATQGIYTVRITGTVGSIIPANATFRSDTNIVYGIENSVVFVAAFIDIDVTSLVSGTVALLSVGDTLIATAPILGVDREVTVTVEVSAPLDIEDIEVYRRSLIETYQLEPQGGSAADYRIWAADAAGVVRVYPFAGAVAGEIDLYIEGDTVDGIPPQSVIDDVESVVNFDPDPTVPLNDRGRKPVSAWLIRYTAITPLPVRIVIDGLDVDTPSIRESIRISMESYLLTVRPFVSGADDPDFRSDSLRLSDVVGVINDSLSRSNFFVSVTIFVDGNNVTNYRFTDGDIPNLTDIDYT